MTRRELEVRYLKHLIIVTIITAVVFVILNAYTSRYNREVTVTGIGNGIVTCVDLAGESWAFRGEGFYIGEQVKLRMSTNGTESDTRDDIILGVIKKGK